MSITRVWRICFATALAGCGGHTLDVGSTDGGSASSGLGHDAGTDAPAGPVWSGYLENAQLPDGSNRLTMTLSVAADGIATGTLLLGDGSLLRPATDPNVGYPPGVSFPFSGPLGFFEGFAYTMLDGRLSGSMLTFRVAEFELWAQWCMLQTMTYPFPDADGGVAGYSCAPTGSSGRGGSFSASGSNCVFTDFATMKQVAMDCGKYELCQNSPCDCSATACHVRSSTPAVASEPDGEPNLAFALVVAGANADGTISGALGAHNVHFVRAQ